IGIARTDGPRLDPLLRHSSEELLVLGAQPIELGKLLALPRTQRGRALFAHPLMHYLVIAKVSHDLEDMGCGHVQKALEAIAGPVRMRLDLGSSAHHPFFVDGEEDVELRTE